MCYSLAPLASLAPLPKISKQTFFFIFQTYSNEFDEDDQGYLMPEELGIPIHVQRALSASKDSAKTLPNPKLRQMPQNSSLPNDNFFPDKRKVSWGNLSKVSLFNLLK